jgi:hypothetical protein
MAKYISGHSRRTSTRLPPHWIGWYEAWRIPKDLFFVWWFNDDIKLGNLSLVGLKYSCVVSVHRVRSSAMITGAQIKAARMLLGWSVPDLARRAAMNIADTQELADTAKVARAATWQ